MTVVAVLADPPREGLVLPRLVETSPLSAAEAADLYAAMLGDVAEAVQRSGGDLLVNYRPDDLLPDEYVPEDAAAEAEVRAAVAEALGDLSEVRFEVQVGSSFDARAGNTVTHLLRDEGETTAAVVRPESAFLARSVVDSAAMKLRRSPVVLGPAPEGRVYYAGFREAVDFDGAFAPPALSTLVGRARDAGRDVDLLETRPVIARGRDLHTAIPYLTAAAAAERVVPPRTAAAVEASGLAVEFDDAGDPRVVRD
jgi:glycosyltransferase A (GT-A) superfamily protein (DUF2064 family)